MPRHAPSAALNALRSSPATIPATFTDTLPLPTLLVFDLDYTLWPFWVDTHVSPPLKPLSSNSSSSRLAMQDRYGETFTFYSEVPSILYEARRKGIFMGLASRTHTPDLAAVLLRGLDIPVPPHRQSESDEEADKPDKTDVTKAIDFFAFCEMYPGSKVKHFKNIQASTKSLGKTNAKIGKGGVPFEDMLFFDDESRNRDVERELGVTFCLVRDGVTRDEVDRGVWEWRKRRGITKKDLGGQIGDGSSSTSRSPATTDLEAYDNSEG